MFVESLVTSLEIVGIKPMSTVMVIAEEVVGEVRTFGALEAEVVDVAVAVASSTRTAFPHIVHLSQVMVIL